jgi:hypothetical protein
VGRPLDPSIAAVLSARRRARQNAWSMSLDPAEPLHTQSKHGLDKQALNVSTPRRDLHGGHLLNQPGSLQKFILRKFGPCSLESRTQVSHLKSEYHAGMPGASAKAIDLIRGIGRHWRIWWASHLIGEKTPGQCERVQVPSSPPSLPKHSRQTARVSTAYLVFVSLEFETLRSARVEMHP